MRSKLFVFTLLITSFGNSLLSDEINKLKNLNLENDIQNSLNSSTFDKVIIHVVKKGDTLSSISKKYSIKKELIIKANKLIDENYIFVRQNLKIIENLISENKNLNKVKASYHEIKEGENLTEIANKYNLSLSKLVEINNIENQNILKVGTKLKVKEEIPSNKDVSKILPKFELDKENIIKKMKYGPLIIRSEKINKEKRNKFLNATHKNGKKIIIHLNCDKKQINVRGIGRKWKGWMPVREKFEEELLNDYCQYFD